MQGAYSYSGPWHALAAAVRRPAAGASTTQASQHAARTFHNAAAGVGLVRVWMSEARPVVRATRLPVRAVLRRAEKMVLFRGS